MRCISSRCLILANGKVSFVQLWFHVCPFVAADAPGLVGYGLSGSLITIDCKDLCHKWWQHIAGTQRQRSTFFGFMFLSISMPSADSGFLDASWIFLCLLFWEVFFLGGGDGGEWSYLVSSWSDNHTISGPPRVDVWCLAKSRLRYSKPPFSGLDDHRHIISSASFLTIMWNWDVAASAW